MQTLDYSPPEGTTQARLIRNIKTALQTAGFTLDNESSTGDLWFHKGAVWIAELTRMSLEAYTQKIVTEINRKQQMSADAAALSGGIEGSGHVVATGILFDAGKAEVKPESSPALREIAKLLQKNPNPRIYGVGHTDNVGPLAANIALSQRAAAVVHELTAKYGVATARLQRYGNAPCAPVASNHSEQGRAQNRRVELVKQSWSAIRSNVFPATYFGRIALVQMARWARERTAPVSARSFVTVSVTITEGLYIWEEVPSSCTQNQGNKNMFVYIRSIAKGALYLALFIAVSHYLRSQVAPSTTLSGSVSDQTGAVVPGASAALTNTATQFRRTVTTDSQGRFLFDLVPPGSYDLSVSASGFTTFNQHGITLDANIPASLRITLAVSGTAEQVTVHENAPMVDTESGTLHQVVSEKYIQDLPLNGRNAATLVYMAPGTVQGKGEDTGGYATTSDTIAVSVNGTYGDQVSYKLDGASHQDNITNLNAAFPNPDALAEFSVQTNNFDAQYGGAGGAVVNIVTKSGSNTLHGTLFEYLRNGDLNARNFFAPQQDALKRNQFGGSLGGPIIRNKLFYFGSYQGTTINNTTFGNTAFVPTAAQRAGNFSSNPKPVVNPATNTAFPGNQIPSELMSPIAAAALQHVPTSTDPTGKLLYAVPSNIRNHQGLAKADYNAGSHQLSGSFFYIHYSDPGWNGGGTLLNYKIGQLQTTSEYKISDTWTITPHLLNSLVVDGLRLDSIQTRTAPFSIFDFGTINATRPAAQFQETAISISGYSGWGSGGSQPPGEWIRDNYEISETLSWIRGAHSMRMGAVITPYTRFDSSTGYQEEPVLNFNGTFTGNALADFLLGRVNTFTQTAGKAKYTRGRQFNAFFQDTWRVTPRLSLDLGLRWDPFLPYTDPVAAQVGGYIPGFHSERFPNAPVGLAFAGDPGFPSAGMYANLGNFAPRAGFSWSAIQGRHATTVRGGFGIFYEMPFVKLYNNFVQNAPFSPSVTLFGVNLADPYASAGVTNPFPPFAPVHPTADTKFVLPLQYQFFDPHWHLGRVNAYNFTIEHQVAPDLVARVAYVGTQGRDLQYFTERNAALYGPGATVSNTNARRPLAPNYASLIEMTNGGISNYNALQATLEKRFSRSFAFVANYTFSKALDNQSVDQQFGLSNPDPFNPNFNYALSDFDTPHNFSLWGLWDLPRLARSSWWLRGPLGGWEMTGIWSWRSGTPFTVVSGQDRSLSGVGLDRADLVANPFLNGDRSTNAMINGYFNTGAFTLNAPGTFGTSPRNLLRGPGYFNVDWSLQKSFAISERTRFQLRGDFFNLFNNVHFNAPGANVSSASTFGRITSAGEPRIVQLALRFEF